jgi:hypothetical protein
LDIVSNAEAVAEAAAASRWFDAIFPSALPITVATGPPECCQAWSQVSGPWDEMNTVSDSYAELGWDRVVGLVPEGWVDDQGYWTVPAPASGASNGKMAPHFSIAEINSAGNRTPAHEIGHTFGLSAQW